MVQYSHVCLEVLVQRATGREFEHQHDGVRPTDAEHAQDVLMSQVSHHLGLLHDLLLIRGHVFCQARVIAI